MNMRVKAIVGAVVAIVAGGALADVISINFNSDEGAASDGNGIIESVTGWNNLSDASGTGVSVTSMAGASAAVTWSCNNLYQYTTGVTDGFLKGYLDDGGNGISITVSNIPFSYYDVVIYQATDTGSVAFNPPAVNGTYYSYDGSSTSATRNDTSLKYGRSQTATAVLGTNVIYLRKAFSNAQNLTIAGAGNASGGRGCIAAIQIVEVSAPVNITLEDGTRTYTSLPTSVENLSYEGDATIIWAGEGTMTTTELLQLVNVSGITGTITYRNITYMGSLETSESGNVYTSGAGTESSAKAISHVGGSLVMSGGTYYLTQSFSSTDSTVVMTNATVQYAGALGVGQATYIVAGNSRVTTGEDSGNHQSFVLSQGAAGRTAVFVLKDTAEVTVGASNSVDSNNSSVMFGHWNGPSTFTIQDAAKFTAPGDVLVGKTSNNQTINVNGGTFSAQGIKVSASASGTNKMNLRGGTLKLGASGITSYASYTLLIEAVEGETTITGTGSGLPITQPITIDAGATLAFGGTVGASLTGELVNNGTLKYVYAAVPTLSSMTGDGTIVVDMTGVELTAGTAYTIVKLASFSVDKVTVIGLPEGSAFTKQASADGVILADTVVEAPIWKGTSGAWTSTTFDGRSMSTDGATVAFDDSTDASVTVSLSGAKTVNNANFIAKTTAYTLTGDALQVTGGLNLTGGASATFQSALTFPDGSLTGGGTLILDPGAGQTVSVPANNTGFTGEAVIASGTVKMGDARSFGEFGREASVRVKAGATLDANGKTNGGNTGVNNKLVLERGGRYSNSVNVGDVKMFSFYDLTVEGDATIDASSVNNGLTRHYGRETYIHLGTNTLTKTGANTFYCSGTTIDGTGLIDIAEGRMDFFQSYGSTQPTFPAGTIKIRSGAELYLDGYGSGTQMTVSNLTVVGTGAVTTGNASATSLTVTGALTMESASSGSELTVPSEVEFTAATTITALGDGTLNLGTLRPTNLITLGEDTGLKVRMQNTADSEIRLSLAAIPASLTVLDAEGSPLATGAYSTAMEEGVLVIRTVAVLPASNGTVFDTADNWTSKAVPSAGQNAVIEIEADSEVTVNGTFALGTLTISGPGRVTFSGAGALSATTLYLANGASYAHGSKVSVSTGYDVAENSKLILDAGEGSLTTSLPISGAGSVETFGAVTMGVASTFTGGLTVKTGTLSTTTRQGYGGSGDTAKNAVVTVENGACADLSNTKDYSYSFVIAGKGVATTANGVTTYSGALKNSGAEIGDGSRQTWSIALTADALITTDADWGLLASSYSETDLRLNGFTLTKRGAGNFWVCHTRMYGGGTLIVEEGTLRIHGSEGIQTDVNLVVAKNGGLKLDSAVSGLASLKFSAGNGGVTFTGVGNLDSAIQPTLDAAYVDASALTPGATVTLLSDSASGLTTNLFPAASIKLGGRFTSATVDAGSITATVATPTKFLHCDFNGAESTPSGVAAADSLYQISDWGDKNGEGPFVGFAGKTSGAAHIFYKSDSDRFVPYWGGNTGNLSPFHAGAMTVTTVAKLACAGDPDRATPAVPVWGLGATTGSNHGLGLVAVDATTVAVVKWEGTTSAVLATKTGIENLATAYHFFAVVLTPYETRLYVDHSLTTSAEVAYADIGQAGQLGSLHGGLIGAYPRVNANDDGYFLDDWAIYDAALTTKEIKTLKRELCPDPFRIRLR